MITHEFKQCGDFVEAEVKWMFADKTRSVKNKFNSPQLADFFVNKVEQKLLIETITKYINHRSYQYESTFMLVYSMHKAETLARLKSLKEIMPGLTFIGLLRTILIYKKDLVEIMPSAKSKFYKHDSKVLKEVFADCENILRHKGQL